MKKYNKFTVLMLCLMSIILSLSFFNGNSSLKNNFYEELKNPKNCLNNKYNNKDLIVINDLNAKTEKIINNTRFSSEIQILEYSFKQPFEGLAPSETNISIECNHDIFTGKPESVIGEDGRVRVTPTTSYPWRTICKLYATWGAITYVGSGAVIDERHVLTAGHCVYSESHGGWADSVKIIPGMDNGNEPYGHAYAIQMRTYNDWINYQSGEHDFAVLTLDSDIGLQTGWMGLETHPRWASIYTQGLNLAGYPADLDGGVNMYFDYDLGTFASEYNHWYIIDISGGQSGSPLWRYDGTNRYILTVHAYSDDGSGSNHGTRIDKNKFDIIKNWIQADKTSTDKPDMSDRGDLYSGFSPITVGSGLTDFNVWCDIQNLGTRSTDIFNVSFYASTDPTITQGDYLVGIDTVSSIYPTDSLDSNLSGKFPNGVPSGTYYIGWIIDAQNNRQEFNEYNNIGIVSSYQLLVDATPPSNPTTCVQINGSTESGVLQNSVNDPEFIWNAASDVHTNVSGYCYYWGIDPFGISSNFTTSIEYDAPKVDSGTYYLRVQTQDKVGNKAPWTTLYIFMYNESMNDNEDNSGNLPDENSNPNTSDDDTNDEELKKEISGYDFFFLIGIILVVSINHIIKFVKKQKILS